MADESRRRPNPLGNVSLGLGVAAAAVVALITLGAVVAVITARNHELERALNVGYALLGTCGEGLAFAGVVTGAAALFRKGLSKNTAIVGLALSILGACLFLPVVGTLLFNGVFGIADRLIR